MPRVSVDHLEARRRQILDAARRCFVRDGFHMTTMHDVLQEAGLSAGAVYRYFPSKEDLIHAIADAALADVTDALSDVRGAADPPPLEEALGRLLGRRPPLDGGRESSVLLIQVWSEAVRSPTLAERYRDVFDGLLRSLAEVVRTYQERGRLSPAVPAESIARALAAMVHGFMVQRAFADVDFATFKDALGALTSEWREELDVDREK
jgi:TetR/AcrR family transcriptional regulator, transcriptional repressor of aconitase